MGRLSSFCLQVYWSKRLAAIFVAASDTVVDHLGKLFVELC